MSDRRTTRVRRLPGVPRWAEFCLWAPCRATGLALIFLDRRLCRSLGQFVLYSLLLSTMPAAFARRSWREALLGRRAGPLAMVSRKTRRKFHSPRWATRTTSIFWRFPRWLSRNVARPLGQLATGLALLIPMATLVARRKWRAALLGSREDLRRQPVPVAAKPSGFMRVVKQSLRGAARMVSWIDRTAVRPMLQIATCTLLALVLPAMALDRDWRAALFARRR